MSEPLRQAEEAAVRERALDPAGSFIVQAPAGSGKTELLAQRVLALLAAVEAPESIVAITFTRKAAAEMRHRILGYLRDAAAPTPDDAPAHLKRTLQLARAARARDAACGWQLQQAPQRLRIQTIDGFCAALVRRSPLLSAAGGPPGIVDDAGALHQRAARAVLQRRDEGGAVADALHRALLHLDHDGQRLTELLAALLGRRDAWRGLIAAADGKGLRRALEDTLARLIDSRMAAGRQRLGEDRLAAWWQAARAAAANRPDHAELQAAVALGRLPETAAEAQHWAPLCELLLTAKNELRRARGVNKTIGFPHNDEHKAALQALLASLAELPDAAETLAALRGLPAADYARHWPMLEDLLLLFRQAAAELQLVFAAGGEVDHTEITLRALQALGPPDAPSELLLKLDHRIEHLLVDEFQDTSDVQHDLLQRLTAGWVPGDGRSLFLVGDPMQSIYRFRAANVGLFLHCARHGLGDLPLQALTISCNFRSQAGIVDWVNRSFPAILGGEDLQAGRVAYSPAIASRERLPGAAVQWHFCDSPQAEAAHIAALCRSVPDDDSIAILLRSRSHAPDILAALRAAGLSAAAVDMDPLASRPVVQDLHSLTRALLAPHDRIAWLALLRAPWCGLPLPALQKLCAGLPAGAPLWPRLLATTEQRDGAAGLPGDAQRRLQRLLPPLQAAMARRGRVDLARVVEQLWLDLGGPASVTEAAELADAERYLQQLASHCDGAASIDAEALARTLQTLYASSDPAADGRLQLMTMHKAKGLQFDHVILPGLSRRVRGDSRPALAQSSLLIDGHERPLIAPIPARGDDDEPLFRLIHNELEGRRSSAETGRLLYVAATRAIRRLHLLARPAFDAQGEPVAGPGLMQSLWPGVGAELTPLLRQRGAAEQSADDDDEAPSAPTGTALRRLPADWRAPPPPAGLPVVTADNDEVAPAKAPEFAWAGERARLTGTLYHDWMERIARDCADGGVLAAWDESRLRGLGPFLEDCAADGGLGAEDAQQVAERVLEALRRTLADADGRWLLSVRGAAELSLDSLRDGRHGNARLDRSFVDADGQRWIIDYKTGHHEGGGLEAFIGAEVARYGDQLRRYAALFADEAQPPRLALYMPLLPAGRRLIEVPLQPADAAD